MLTLQYSKGFFRITEVIGKGNFNNNNVTDVQVKLELLTSPPEALLVKGITGRNSFELNTPNFIIDVTQDEETIYKKIHKGTRADIRKAIENEQFTYREIDHPTDKQLEEFSVFYNSFAKEKGISACNIKKLLDLRNQNSLIMTTVEDKNNYILCAGMLYIDRNCMQLYGLYGATIRMSKTTTIERKVIGRANKFLHWREIQLAKRKGLNWYNFGGEVKGEGGQGINDFKKRFGAIGGFDRRIYTSKSMLGKICVNLLYYKWKMILKS